MLVRGKLRPAGRGDYREQSSWHLYAYQAGVAGAMFFTAPSALGAFPLPGECSERLFYWATAGMRCPVPRQNMEKAGVNPPYLI